MPGRVTLVTPAVSRARAFSGVESQADSGPVESTQTGAMPTAVVSIRPEAEPPKPRLLKLKTPPSPATRR